MDFKDRILQLATQATRQRPVTEEATKNALIMPFIQAIGYDVFNLDEVHPEFVCDVGVKKGEKVDYAIMRDGKPIILIECKISTTDLNIGPEYFSQLFRYFTVTEARFGVLTNGIEYRFFTDLDKPNKMDEKPFFVFHLLDPNRDEKIEELKKFTKAAFNVEQILSKASELKYKHEIKALFSKQLTDPDAEFVEFFARHVYQDKEKRKLTAGVRQQFTQLTKDAIGEFMREDYRARISKAFESEDQSKPEPAAEENGDIQKTVETSEDEREAYLIVRAILRKVVDSKRVVMRDTQSYCGVLLDDNNRKPICRLHFNHAQKKYIGLFDANKQEERISINSIDDIYQYAERLRATVGFYAQSAEMGLAEPEPSVN